MAWQLPKKDHPWRTGKMSDMEGAQPKKERKVKQLKIFIQEIAESWDEVRVVTTSTSGYGEYTLSQLPQEKQAAWLAGILKRNYASY
jgi:hypothetical protein